MVTMTTRESNRLQSAITELTEEYEKSLKNPRIRQPLAYALYRVWRSWNAREPHRSSKEE